ncbi:MAG: DNA repair protein RecN, partial [Lachnospiraceae bacterium]|nr:DNA repair protein RecN [Lachnospiraceae bacterium]
MLEYISIKNAALIEEAEVNFRNGLNILSGETGSGKSMVIDSINFVLGERTSKDFIRKETDLARVEALFTVADSFDKEGFVDAGIDIEDGTVLISRTLNKNGRSVSRINGVTVTLSMVKELSESLIDIHGQHEHQSLLNSAKHIALLDKFCGSELDTKKAELSGILNEYKAHNKKYSGLIANREERARKCEELARDIAEIKKADIKDGEEERLEKRQAVLENAERIAELGNNALELIYGGDGSELSAYDKLSRAGMMLSELEGLDSETGAMAKSAESASAVVEDLARELKRYIGRMDIDESEIAATEKRLDIIYEIKRKYGPKVEDVVKYLKNAEEEYDKIINSDEIIARLNKEKEVLINKVNALCAEISSLREEKAQEIEVGVEKELKDMEMKDASFRIIITPKKGVSSNGKDNVEFLISANKGEELKPLAKIASGGEMSRVMLALKTVLSDSDNIDTFIFD